MEERDEQEKSLRQFARSKARVARQALAKADMPKDRKAETDIHVQTQTDVTCIVGRTWRHDWADMSRRKRFIERRNF